TVGRASTTLPPPGRGPTAAGDAGRARPREDTADTTSARSAAAGTSGAEPAAERRRPRTRRIAGAVLRWSAARGPARLGRAARRCRGTPRPSRRATGPGTGPPPPAAAGAFPRRRP